jgi:hypothetical protein
MSHKYSNKVERDIEMQLELYTFSYFPPSLRGVGLGPYGPKAVSLAAA